MTSIARNTDSSQRFAREARLWLSVISILFLLLLAAAYYRLGGLSRPEPINHVAAPTEHSSLSQPERQAESDVPSQAELPATDIPPPRANQLALEESPHVDPPAATITDATASPGGTESGPAFGGAFAGVAERQPPLLPENFARSSPFAARPAGHHHGDLAAPPESLAGASGVAAPAPIEFNRLRTPPIDLPTGEKPDSLDERPELPNPPLPTEDAALPRANLASRIPESDRAGEIEKLDLASGEFFGRGQSIPFTSDQRAAASIVAGDNDSYWSIAQHRYGDGRLFRALFQVNREMLGETPHLEPGALVHTPPLATLVEKWPQLIPADVLANMPVTQHMPTAPGEKRPAATDE